VTDPGGASRSYPSLADVEKAFAQRVNRGKVDAFARLGLHLVMGEREGARFRDEYSGRWYWNCHCNGGVFNLGHRHPQVIEAVRRALDHVDIGNHHFVSPHRAHLAEQLAATTGDTLPAAVFGVSGGEAVDLALKLARGHTGRTRIVSVHGAFHGCTGLAVSAGELQYREPFAIDLPGFVHVPFNDVAAMDAAVGDDTAAVILESIPATLGFPPPEPGYLAAVEQLCRDRGALLLLDEVQTGLGRTGTVWYYEQEGVSPDMLVTGKGLSGGIVPITATLVSADLHAFFDEHPFAHISTFGGSEIGCVAASAVLDVVTEPAFLARVRELGERFEAGFAGAPFGLRRRGLTMGLVFSDPNGGMYATAALLEHGVWALFANHDPSVLQFKPPLTVTDAEADEIVATVRRALG
jgi:putrescine aminotransferase